MQYTFGSLFCGCGGFDLGFINEKFNCIAAYDNDPNAIKVYKKNIGHNAYNCDLSNPDPGIDALTKIKNLDVLIAGTPCQGFSTAGKRKLDDPRNRLLICAGQIARNVLPKIFILENVPGVKSGEFDSYWNYLKKILEESSYRTEECIIEGIRMGIPQIRKRIFLFAWRSAENIKIDLSEIPGGTLRDALVGLDGLQNHDLNMLEKNSRLEKIAQRIKPGQKLSNVRGGPSSIHTWDIPEVFGNTLAIEKDILSKMIYLRRRGRVRDSGDADPVSKNILYKEFGPSIEKSLSSLQRKGFIRNINGRYDLTRTFNGKFRRLQLNMPSPTVHTRFGDPRYFLHPELNRGFTVREAARIQGFPDDFIFYGPDTTQYRLIGNAVPPPISRSIAAFVKSKMLTRL